MDLYRKVRLPRPGRDMKRSALDPAEPLKMLIKSNLPFDERTETFGSERPLDRLNHHVAIPEMNGDSYRLAQSKARQIS